MSNSPNLNMPLPIPTVTPGPDYAQDLVDSLTLIDNHDHSSGKGLLITPSALNINADIDFKSYSPKNVKTVQLDNLTVDSTVNRSVYFKNGELFIKDSVGNTVQVTNAGNIAGAVGTITGLVSPASASYSSVTKSFTFNFNSGSPGGLNVGDLRLYPFDSTTSYANFITLKAPTALAGQYNLTMPTALATTTGTRFTVIDASGNLSIVPAVMPTTSGKRIVQMDELGNVTQAFQPLPSITSSGIVSTLADGTLSIIKPTGSHNIHIPMLDESGNDIGFSDLVTSTYYTPGKYYYFGMDYNRNTGFFTDAYGLVPYGGIIAIASHLTGAYSIPASGVITGGGWMLCDGAAIPPGYSVSGYTPSINNGQFLRGYSFGSGGFGGVNSQTINAHSHGMDHVHQALYANTTNIYGLNSPVPSTTTFNSGSAYAQYILGGSTAVAGSVASFSGVNPGTLFTGGSLNSGYGSRNSTDNNSAFGFDNQPNYMNITYLIRCS